jgi:hypothetical protein
MAAGRWSLPAFLASHRLLQQVLHPFGDDNPRGTPGFEGAEGPLAESYEERLYLYLTSAARAYDPKPYPGRVLLLLSEQQPTGWFLDPTLGWSAYAAQGVEVARTAGDHFTMFRRPGVEQMAHRIARSLAVGLGGAPPS